MFEKGFYDVFYVIGSIFTGIWWVLDSYPVGFLAGVLVFLMIVAVVLLIIGSVTEWTYY